MEVKNYLEVVDEKKVELFLKDTLGESSIENVVKYYDGHYDGFVFLVKMAEGVNFLPKEEGDFLRLGQYGFVTDDVTNPVPTAKNDLSLSFEYPEFLSQYVTFISGETEEVVISGVPYIDNFKKEMMLYLMMNKHAGHEEINNEFYHRRKLVYDIANSAQEQEKE